MRRIKWFVILLGFGLGDRMRHQRSVGLRHLHDVRRGLRHRAIKRRKRTVSSPNHDRGAAPSCHADGIGFGAIATDSLGNYRAFVISDFRPTAVCLIVTAQPADTGRFHVAADTGHVVSLESDYTNQGQDSVRVDLVVPPFV